MNPTAGTGFRNRSVSAKADSSQSRSIDNLLQQRSPLDQLVSDAAKPSSTGGSSPVDMDTETLQTGLNNRGYAAGAIDGKLGPKTLEALNMFQQDQIDSLKAQIHNTPNPALRAQMEIRVSALIKESKGIKPGRETLSALNDPLAKQVLKTSAGGLASVAVSTMPLASKGNDQR